MNSQNLDNYFLKDILLTLTSYTGLIFIGSSFLIIITLGSVYLVKALKDREKLRDRIEKDHTRREVSFLHDSIREELESKINAVISKEESELGEYSGTDLIERINLELDKAEQHARSMPVGSAEAIAHLKVIGDWRLQLQRGLLNAING